MKPPAFHGPAGLGLAALLAGVAAGAQATGCQAAVPGVEVGVLRSHWEEFGAQGQSLVREQGTLGRTALTLDLACGPLTWSARWDYSQGTRAYDGVSNTGAPVATTSAIAGTELALQGLHALDQHWSWGLRLNRRQLRRDIAAVLGYPERLSYWQAALGLRYERPLTPQVSLSAMAWIGGGPGGRLAVRLPRTDPARLELGSSRLVRLGLQIGRAAPAEPRPGWSWQVGWYYQKERMGAGAARTLTRSGIPVGAALQPRTEQTARGIDFRLQYRF